MKPNMPRDLTAELARDTNLSGFGNQGVLLQWNQPASVPGAPVNAYKVERSKDGGDYEVLASSHTSSRTYYPDLGEPKADEMWTYRVTAINIAGAGMDMATAMIPYPGEHTTHPPATEALTAPDNVMASDAGNPVTVTWDPGMNADGGHLILVFNSDFTDVPGIAVPTEEGTHTFTGVTFAAGDYVAVVVSIKARDDYLYDYDTFTVQ